MRILIFALLLFCSCSTIRKNSGSSSKQQSHIDSSTTTSNYRRETTTTEKGEAIIYLGADSLETTGYLPIDDTCSNTQEVESNGMSISTMAVPRKDSTGRTTGFDLKTKAKIKPRTVPVPIEKTAHIVETGEKKEQAAVKDTYSFNESWWTKQVKRPSAGIQIAAGALLILFIILLICKLWKR